MHQRSHEVPRIGIFAVIVFNKLGKHTHTLNKIVGIKATKRQCKKTSNLGRQKVVPTQNFWPRIVYNDKLLMSQSEMEASKNTAKESYAQALGNTVGNKDHEVKAAGIFSGDVTQNTSPCTSKVCKRDVKNFSPINTNLCYYKYCSMFAS